MREAYEAIVRKVVGFLAIASAGSDLDGYTHVMKTDDDSFVNIRKDRDPAARFVKYISSELLSFEALLLRLLNGNQFLSDPNRRLLLGFMFEVPGRPAYLSGAGYVLSRAAVECIAVEGLDDKAGEFK